MGKIATLNEAMQIAGSSEATTTQICATKKDAVDVGCKVAGTYAEQQLVQKDDLSKAVEKVNVGYNIYFNAIPVGTMVRYSLVYKSTSGHTVRRNGNSSGATVSGTFECNKVRCIILIVRVTLLMEIYKLHQDLQQAHL